MNTTKNFITSDNRLLKARVNKVSRLQWVNGSVEAVEFEVEEVKKDGKWVSLKEIGERGRFIKTKTLCCTKVNHKSSVAKVFTEFKRYQVYLRSGVGQNAGYIYDKDGNAWQLYRDEEVGFTTLCQTYKFESMYK